MDVKSPYMRENFDPISHYVQVLQAPLPPIFGDIEDQLKADDMYGINIGVTEGTILAFLVKAFRVRSILEIGTQYGYSAHWFLKNLPADGTLITLEKNPAHYLKAVANVTDKRCTLLCGDAQMILADELKDKSFDLIFIDANKKAYPEYLRYAREHVNMGGLIIGDNTFMKKSVFADAGDTGVDPKLTEAMRTFNREIFSDNQFTSCIVPTSEGMTIAYRN